MRTSREFSLLRSGGLQGAGEQLGAAEREKRGERRSLPGCDVLLLIIIVIIGRRRAKQGQPQPGLCVLGSGRERLSLAWMFFVSELSIKRVASTPFRGFSQNLIRVPLVWRVARARNTVLLFSPPKLTHKVSAHL